MDQSNSDTKVGSLICYQNDILLLRDCEIIPLAYYTYGSGDCSGNGVSIACSKDQPTSTVSTVKQTNNEGLDMYLVVIVMSVIVGLVLCLLVGGLLYCNLTVPNRVRKIKHNLEDVRRYQLLTKVVNAKVMTKSTRLLMTLMNLD
ncbi:uncharacterized protein LOC128224062 [Mya arenaria]|uniref:uncharacterized protein LOC128224062 n=1 Tax=Mya arenaria TaxID=6604 RepID=UPI0022E8919B|nr:uncharacterized protein LOC128224062 [Mya arenaria]